MPRKPIELEHVGLRTPRERMWAAMKTLVDFTPAQIEDRAHPVHVTTVLSYLEGLVKAGFVERVGECRRFTAQPFRVVRFAAVTPQLDSNGKPIRPNLGVLAMWRAMKVRRTFDASLVAADATQGTVACSIATAKAYLKHLGRAGYLAEVRKPHNGGGLTVYRLVRDTGPLPPAITRAKVVYDRNTGDLHAVSTAQEVCDALE